MAGTVPGMKVVTNVRDFHIETMEKALNVWLEDNSQKNGPLSGPRIHEEAKQMYDHLVGTGGVANKSDVGTSNALSDAGTHDAGTRGTQSLPSSQGMV